MPFALGELGVIMIPHATYRACFLLIVSVLVLIHELGHFLVAKKLNIKVEEFGFGLPPRVFGIKRERQSIQLTGCRLVALSNYTEKMTQAQVRLAQSA